MSRGKAFRFFAKIALPFKKKREGKAFCQNVIVSGAAVNEKKVAVAFFK